MDELTAVYREVYAEPPYEWGAEHMALFSERFARQRQTTGFRLVEARSDDELIAFGFGVTLGPTIAWRQGWLIPTPYSVTREYIGRTFVLIELLVRRPWRRLHVAETIHSRLMQGRTEKWATLTALPAAHAAQAAYTKWGWLKVAQKHIPLPGSPIFDVLVKELSTSA
jgi:hypothetical protein